MGLFSSVTRFLGKVADGVVQTVAPGCSWKPSSLIQQAEGLLPVAVNAIPGVGPLLSSAVPAIQSIFSGSTKNESENTETPKVPNLDEVKKLLENSLSAIKDTRTALEGKLDKLADQLERERQLAKFDEYVGKITPAIEYYKDSMKDLTAFVPFTGDKRLELYVKKDQDNNLKLSQLHFDLYKSVEEMQKYLSSHIPTQDMVDLYVFAVVWLLTYDKTVMTLRGYLAQHFLVQNAMTSYTDAITAWNQDFKEMQTHAQKCSTFILGDGKTKGFIEELREKREKAIGSAKSETADDKTFQKFEDSYPKYGIGYVGQGSSPDESGLALSIESKDEKAGKGMRNGYASVNTSYFDIATRAATEAAEVWRESLYRWQGRLPLSPPLNAGNLVTEAQVSSLEVAQKDESFGKDVVGLGWKTGETLCYAVSYVTTFGEGFLSGWSQAVEIKEENQYVKLQVEPITFPPNDFTKGFDKAINPKGIEVEIVRRVYVQITAQDKTSTYFVGHVRGPADKPLTIWDQAQHHRPNPKVSEGDKPVEGGDSHAVQPVGRRS